MEFDFQELSPAEKSRLTAIADFACELGYSPKRDKSRSISYTFHHPKVKKTILRFVTRQGRPVLSMKFFSSKEYSEFFHQTIRAAIEEYDYKYTGCYGCDNHCNKTDGYRYRYPDGREYYRCGTELIEIQDFTRAPLEETLALLKRQHEFYLSKLK